MRLVGLESDHLVTGNISSHAYKKLYRVLSPLPHDELWQVLDHYIFHCMDDQEVDALVGGLESMRATGIPLTAEVALGFLESDENRYIVKSTPTQEELESSRSRLDLLFDETFFESYLPPSLRAKTALELIAFCEKNEIPQMPHWEIYLNSQKS